MLTVCEKMAPTICQERTKNYLTQRMGESSAVFSHSRTPDKEECMGYVGGLGRYLVSL